MCRITVQSEGCVETLAPSSGSVVAAHPHFSDALGVALLYSEVMLVHAPVLAALEHVYVTVRPRKGGVGVAGRPLEEISNWLGIRPEVGGAEFIPLPVS